MKRIVTMNSTPVIPNGYNGPIKQLTCRICKHIFYLTMADYGRLTEIYYCHECSLILLEELERNQGAQSSIPPKQTPMPASPPLEQASAAGHRPPEAAFVSLRPVIRIPQPRTIDRDKMTVEQLLEEAKMLDKTWRYKEALLSYEQALQRDPGCLAAFYGKGEMLSQLSRPEEALAVYDAILHLDPTLAKTCGEKGWVLISLKRYKEAQAAFDHALQLDPADSRAQNGNYFLCSYILQNQGVEEKAGSERKQTAARETLAKPCQSAEDYYESGNALIVLKRDIEAFARSIELDPLILDVYERVGILHYYRGNYEKSLAVYNQAFQIFFDCAMLYEKRAEALVRLKRYQAEAKERLEAAGKEISDDAIKAELHLMHEEKRAAELKASLRASPLFQPICLLLQEWIGTPKQFKEIICSRFPDEFAAWYRAPYKYVDELKKIAPELRLEGIAVGVPPETTLVTLNQNCDGEAAAS
jgi:tetratricopeptide (TPR) repeat protein